MGIWQTKNGWIVNCEKRKKSVYLACGYLQIHKKILLNKIVRVIIIIIIIIIIITMTLKRYVSMRGIGLIRLRIVIIGEPL